MSSFGLHHTSRMETFCVCLCSFCCFFCRNLGWEISRPWLPSKDVLACKQLPLQDKLLLYPLQGVLIPVHPNHRGKQTLKTSWWGNRSRAWYRGSWPSFRGEKLVILSMKWIYKELQCMCVADCGPNWFCPCALDISNQRFHIISGEIWRRQRTILVVLHLLQMMSH